MTTKTKTSPRIANATRTSGNTYTVTYVGHAEMDRDVPYGYLRQLAKGGCRVEVQDWEGNHTIAAE